MKIIFILAMISGLVCSTRLYAEEDHDGSRFMDRDVGSQILSCGPRNFLIRSFSLGSAESVYVIGDGKLQELTLPNRPGQGGWREFACLEDSGRAFFLLKGDFEWLPMDHSAANSFHVLSVFEVGVDRVEDLSKPSICDGRDAVCQFLSCVAEKGGSYQYCKKSKVLRRFLDLKFRPFEFSIY